MSKELDALKQIYDFSKNRGFKLGLNEKYVEVPDRERVVEKLLERKLVYILNKYDQNYLIPTEEGINLIERNALKPKSRFEYIKVKNPRTDLFVIFKKDLQRTGFGSTRIIANIRNENEAEKFIKANQKAEAPNK